MTTWKDRPLTIATVARVFSTIHNVNVTRLLLMRIGALETAAESFSTSIILALSSDSMLSRSVVVELSVSLLSSINSISCFFFSGSCGSMVASFWAPRLTDSTVICGRDSTGTEGKANLALEGDRGYGECGRRYWYIISPCMYNAGTSVWHMYSVPYGVLYRYSMLVLLQN